jgi:Neuraminidase (sialidase)
VFNRRQVLQLTPAILASSAAAPVAKIISINVISHQPVYYHAWPTLVRRKNGELLAAYSGGREAHIDPFGRVELSRSRDDGRTWSWPQIVMDTPVDDRDAGVVETAQGTILISTFTSLAYEKVRAEAKDWEADRLERWDAVVRATSPAEKRSLVGAWMIRSSDGGLTFSQPYKVPVTSPHGPIVLRDGRLLYPGKRYGGPQKGEIGICESRDDGLTWKWMASIPSRPGDDFEQYHELHGVEASDGRLIVHVRNHNQPNERETLQTESTDGGKTWSVPRPIGVWGLPSHLLRLRDGRLLMSYSYRRAPRGNHARVSSDHGRTWSEPIVLSDDGTGDLGYPSTVELPGGELLTLWYEYKRSGSVAAKLPAPPFSELRHARWTLAR